LIVIDNTGLLLVTNSTVHDGFI